jgi:hypothetical protein
MFVPSQGFRHAATLLLTNRARAIPSDASSETVREMIALLAHELVALADDTRAPGEAAAWLTAELNATIDRLPQSFDRPAAKAEAAAVLARVALREPPVEPRDVFLVYVPEDRLSIAAPLAVELTKRRVSVAFANYEVATVEELRAAVTHGLGHHGGGVILQTTAFDRGHWPPLPPNRRLQFVKDPAGSSVSDLAAWANRLRLSKI